MSLSPLKKQLVSQTERVSPINLNKINDQQHSINQMNSWRGSHHSPSQESLDKYFKVIGKSPFKKESQKRDVENQIDNDDSLQSQAYELKMQTDRHNKLKESQRRKQKAQGLEASRQREIQSLLIEQKDLIQGKILASTQQSPQMQERESQVSCKELGTSPLTSRSGSIEDSQKRDSMKIESQHNSSLLEGTSSSPDNKTKRAITTLADIINEISQNYPIKTYQRDNTLDEMNIEIKRPTVSQIKLNKTNSQEKELIWKSSVQDLSHASSKMSLNFENSEKFKNLANRKNRARVYKSLDEHGLHQILENSKGFQDPSNKFSRYELYLRRALLDDICDNQTQSLKQIRNMVNKQIQAQGPQSELKRLTSMERNRKDLVHDERLDKTFAITRYASHKKQAKNNAIRTRRASSIQLQGDATHGGQQSQQLPFAWPGQSNHIEYQEFNKSLGQDQEKKQLYLHSYIGSMQNLDQTFTDQLDNSLASPHDKRAANEFNAINDSLGANAKNLSFKTSMFLPNIPRHQLESGTYQILPDKGAQKSGYEGTQDSNMMSGLTTGRPSDQHSSGVNQLKTDKESRNRLNQSLILKHGSLNQSAFEGEDSSQEQFDQFNSCQTTSRRLNNFRENSRKRIETNITMSIKRAEKHDSQSLLQKHYQSSRIIREMSSNRDSIHPNNQLRQQDNDGNLKIEEQPVVQKTPLQLKKFTEMFAKPPPLVDVEAARNAPKFVQKNQFSLESIREELALTKLRQSQQNYSQKFASLQKEHKKEFKSYLSKQFNIDGKFKQAIPFDDPAILKLLPNMAKNNQRKQSQIQPLDSKQDHYKYLIERAVKKREQILKQDLDPTVSELTESSFWNESQRESRLESARDKLKNVVRQRQIEVSEKKPVQRNKIEVPQKTKCEQKVDDKAEIEKIESNKVDQMETQKIKQMNEQAFMQASNKKAKLNKTQQSKKATAKKQQEIMKIKKKQHANSDIITDTVSIFEKLIESDTSSQVRERPDDRRKRRLMQKVLRTSYRYIGYQAPSEVEKDQSIQLTMDAAKEILLKEFDEQSKAHVKFKSSFSKVVERGKVLRQNQVQNLNNEYQKLSKTQPWKEANMELTGTQPSPRNNRANQFSPIAGFNQLDIDNTKSIGDEDLNRDFNDTNSLSQIDIKIGKRLDNQSDVSSHDVSEDLKRIEKKATLLSRLNKIPVAFRRQLTMVRVKQKKQREILQNEYHAQNLIRKYTLQKSKRSWKLKQSRKLLKTPSKTILSMKRQINEMYNPCSPRFVLKDQREGEFASYSRLLEAKKQSPKSQDSSLDIQQGKAAFINKMQQLLKQAIEPQIVELIKTYEEGNFEHPKYGTIKKLEGKSYAKSIGDPRHSIYFMEKNVFQLSDDTRKAHLRKKRQIIEVKRDRHFKHLLQGIKFEDGRIAFEPCRHDCYGDDSNPEQGEKDVEIAQMLKNKKRKQPLLLSYRRSELPGKSKILEAKRRESQPETQLENELIVDESNASKNYDSEDDWMDVDDSEEQEKMMKSLAMENQPFKKENDKIEALQYNGQDLPFDFLMAKLSQRRETKKHFISEKKKNNQEQLHKLNSDMFFNQDYLFEEEAQPDDLDRNHELKDVLVELPDNFETGLESVVSEFIEKAKFLQSLKEYDKVSVKQRTQVGQLFQQFSKSSLDYGNIPIPIMLMIKKGVLSLPPSFVVNEGIATAMQNTLQNLEDFGIEDGLQKAIFDRNSLTDKVFVKVLSGLTHRKELNSLTSICNEIGIESAGLIKQMLEPKKMSDNQAELQELAIINNKISTQAIDVLFEALPSTNNLRHLTLQNLRCTNSQYESLFKFIKDTRVLVSLDLSWSKMSIQIIGNNLFGALEKNKSLNYLNLSHIKMNSMVLQVPFKTKFCRFIQENQRLLHLNMTSVDLVQELMHELIVHLKRSISLQCVHLCNNKIDQKGKFLLIQKLKPHLTQERLQINQSNSNGMHQTLITHLNNLNKAYSKRHEKIYEAVKIKEVLKQWMTLCIPYEKQTKSNLNLELEDHTKLLEFQQNQYNMLQSRSLPKSTMQSSSRTSITNQTGQNTNKSGKKFASTKQQPKDKTKPETNKIEEITPIAPNEPEHMSKPLILNKVLGHKEILNSRNWKASNECWMCEKWKYTLIFWDAKSSLQYQIKDSNLEDLLQKLIFNQNNRLQEAVSKQQESSSHSGQPYILGTFTNWQPRRMMTAGEFSAILQNDLKILNSTDKDIINQYNDEAVQQMSTILLEHKPYKDGQCFGLQKSITKSRNPCQIFVYCDFLKPGKHQYMVSYVRKIHDTDPYVEDRKELEKLKLQQKARFNALESPPKLKLPEIPEYVQSDVTVRMTTYHQIISEPYAGEYLIKTKAENQDHVRTFSKENSVFKDWRNDRKDKIIEGFMNEIKYWKVPNLVKDSEQVAQITAFLKSEIEFLKTAFIVRSAQSHFPVIKTLSFNHMIQSCIPDDVAPDQTKSTCDRIFIAVTKNTDQELRGTLPEKDMTRMHFYEALVRVAIYKFKTPQTTPIEAVKKFIEMVKRNFDISMWMPWRQSKLYTLEIDDLYKSNLIQMRALHRCFFVAKKTKSFYYEDAIELFGIDAEIGLHPEAISLCWGLSKQTVYNDITQREKYLKLDFVEFLEFFARVADYHYGNSYLYKNETLPRKIELLMDQLFQVIKQKRQPVTRELEYVSESEEELDPDKWIYN